MPFEAEGYVVAGVYDGGQIHSINHTKNDLPLEMNFDYLAKVTKIVLASIFDNSAISSKGQ
jgi:hypothetical protein